KKDLPSLTLSMLPIVLPIVLIFIKAIVDLLIKQGVAPEMANGYFYQIITFVGSPITALALSVLVSVYTLLPNVDKNTTAIHLEEGVKTAGIILLVTGAGGALGAVLRDSGAGKQLAEQVANLPISPILIPFIVSTLVRFVQA